ncbi:MAG: SAM-dependent methyltransferase [Puniceicoccaceae bacterium]
MERGGDKTLDPQVREVLEQHLAPATGTIPLETFIDLALYHPQVGYYLRPESRVGHRSGTDFYTAQSLGTVYSNLVLAALEELSGSSLDTFSLVEFGPESSAGTMGPAGKSPFRETLLVRPGEAFTIPSRSIVFSNELFDAQPFRRFIRRNDKWMEAGVRITDNALDWCELEPAQSLPPLPEASEGYIIDWPGQARQLMQDICSQSWEGLFVAFDYGLERSVIFSERPSGTGRTYADHQLGTDLLANPGHIDITCHVIWDELEDALRDNAFESIRIERQEAFFMHHSRKEIARILEGSAGSFSPEKQTLMELLHPENMGHKFQVLSARRGEL